MDIGYISLGISLAALFFSIVIFFVQHRIRARTMAIELDKVFHTGEKRKIRVRIAQIYIDKHLEGWTSADYIILGEILGFFENLGKLVKAGIVDKDTIWNFLGEWIRCYYAIFQTIIKKRREDSLSYYENLEWLVIKMDYIDAKHHYQFCFQQWVFSIKRFFYRPKRMQPISEMKLNHFMKSELTLTEIDAVLGGQDKSK